MIKVGDMVKIEDIGVLALCVSIEHKDYELELCGERFWLPQDICHPVVDDEEVA